MGNYDDARKDFQRARELAPQNPVVNYNLAREMMREDRYKEAVRAYSIYIKNRPEDPAGYAGRGIARFKMAQVDDAEEDLDKAVELGTRNAEVYKTRAIIRSDAGNYEGAAADFSAAGRLEEGLPAQPTEEELEEGEPAGLNS
jgi:tetratricopeptide (TPR) repeat protein